VHNECIQQDLTLLGRVRYEGSASSGASRKTEQTAGGGEGSNKKVPKQVGALLEQEDGD
jgi:hypothetical protein